MFLAGGKFSRSTLHENYTFLPYEPMHGKAVKVKGLIERHRSPKIAVSSQLAFSFRGTRGPDKAVAPSTILSQPVTSLLNAVNGL